MQIKPFQCHHRNALPEGVDNAMQAAKGEGAQIQITSVQLSQIGVIGHDGIHDAAGQMLLKNALGRHELKARDIREDAKF